MLDIATPGAADAALLALAHDMRRWVTSGALQSPTGGMYAWREAASGTVAFEYPEISGYTLTYIAGRPNLIPAERRVGDLAARWLLDRWTSGDLCAHEGYDHGAAYNFDLAMIATGLLRFGRRRMAPALVDCGLEIVADLREQQLEHSALPAIRHADRVRSSRSAWSTEGFAHLVKTVQCCLLAESLGDRGAGQAARETIEHARTVQTESGRFITHPADRETMLHPHMYAVEGLWMFAQAHGDEDAFERAQRGLTWAWQHQLESGGFPRYVTTRSGERGTEQWDLSSQMLRMALLIRPELPGIDLALARLVALARRDETGAYLMYQPTSKLLHQNMWVTMFAAQALEVAAAHTLSWETLV